MAGWGATDPEGLSPSDTLREVTVTVISRKLCNSPSYYNHQPVITRGLVCAGDAKGQKDSCQVRAASGRRGQRWAPGEVCSPARAEGPESTEPRPAAALRPCTAPAAFSIFRVHEP